MPSNREEIRQLKIQAGLKPFQSRLKDLESSGGEYVARCPWHESTGNHSPSLHVYKGEGGEWFFKCMSRCDDKKGDVIAFVRLIDKVTFADACRIIATEAGIAEAPVSAASLGQPTKEQFEQTQEYLAAHGVPLELAKERGLDAVIHPKLGLAVRMPYDADPQVVKFRAVVPEDKSAKFSHASGHPSDDLLYNIKQTEKELGTSFFSEVYVVESERDCLTMNAHGFMAVSVSSATACVDQDGQLKIDEDQLKSLARADEIYLALDQDPAGQKCADAFEVNPTFNSNQVKRIEWKYGGRRSDNPKDIGDLYKQDPAGFRDKIEALAHEARCRPPKWRQMFRTVGELESGPIIELIKGFLTEGNIGIGGLSGAGKTFLALSIARALTTGVPFVGKFPVPEIVPVLYLIPEVGKRQFQKRVKAFCIPDDENLFLCRTLSEGPALPLQNPFVLEAVRQLHNPVVILDTAIRFSEAKDENASVQNAWMERSIRSLREAGCIAVIALHHSPKNTERESPTLENTFRGTGDIGALLDIAYSVRTDRYMKDSGEGEQVTIQCVKARDFEDVPPRFNLGLKYRKAGQTKLASFIEECGDMAMMTATDHHPAVKSPRQERHSEVAADKATFLKLVQNNSRISLRSLQAKMGYGRSKVKRIAERVGYEQQNEVWVAPEGENSADVLETPDAVQMAS